MSTTNKLERTKGHFFFFFGWKLRKHDLYAEVVELTTSIELHITGYKNHPNKKASQKRNIEYYL